jgi:hypothetical protein
MAGAWAVFVIVDIAVTYVCFMKGKTAMAWIGVVGVIPPLTFVLVLVPLIGAMTPAKAGSKWARPPLDLPPPPPDAWRYTPTDLGVQRPRPEASQPASTPTESFLKTPVNAEQSLSDPAASAERADTALNSTRAVEIRAFLKQAVRESVIDGATYVALVSHLEETLAHPKPVTPRPPLPTPAPSTPPTAPPQPVAPPAPTPPQPAEPRRPPKPAPSPAISPAAAAPPRSRPSPAPAPGKIAASSATTTRPAPKPAVPREPSAFAAKRAELWEAFTSDVAVHGLVYLGVLLTFVSVLGFMLFAFKDLPISAKPFVELLIVLTFFGWAWVLNHQNAARVSKAMELLGGMILPLVWYAALVDSATVPPDAEGDWLVFALVASSLALSGIYWLISRRFENSMLRFLAWPMVWVASMGVGFLFKTDEHLVGDAITRLVAPQPALASVTIAATLAFLAWRSDSRLAESTYRAALVGMPSAYLLTFGLSLGDSAAVWWPIIVSGAGTVASIELVAHWYGWQARLRPLRPYVYALVGVPLVLAIGIGWGGAIVAVSYVVLIEMAIRSPKIELHDVTSAATGAVVGLLLSLAEPGAAIVAFGAVSVWAHIRRRMVIGDEHVVRSIAGVAALAPLGLLYGLSGLTSVPASILIVSSLVLVAAVFLRLRDRADNFDSVWFPIAATALGVGAAVVWTVDGSDAALVIASLVISSATVALGQRWPTANVWLSAALGSIAVAILLDTLDATGATAAVTWSAIGVVVIVLSMVTHGGAALRVGPGHLSVLGHVIGLFAFTTYGDPGALTIAIAGLAIGWALSLAASERRGGVNPVDIWTTPGAIDSDRSATVETHLDAVAPYASAIVSVAAAVSLFFEVSTDGDDRVWLGFILGCVAVVYSITTRWLLSSDHGRTVFAWSAGLLAVGGVGLSYAEPRAVIATSLLVIVVRVVLHGVASLTWLTWLTWLTPPVIATALAHEFGLADESLAGAALGVAIAMLLGALVTDGTANGSRKTGDFVRAGWLLPPAVIGAVLIPISVATLFAAGSTFSEWAGALAAFALAIASAMLKRSIWVTATLGSVALAFGLHAAHVSAVGSASTWSVLGVGLLILAIGTRRLPQDDVAGIGHAVGAIGLAYALDDTAMLIALTAWAFGWLLAVTTSEMGGPSISNVLERSSKWWDESNSDWTTTSSQGLPAVMAVAVTTAAAIGLYSEYATFADASVWVGVVFAILGLVFAAAGAHVVRTRPSSLVFGWGGLVLASSAVTFGVPEPLPIAVTTSLFIVTRVAVLRLIPFSWLTWITWFMPTAALTAVASEFGVPDASLAGVAIVTGGAMLIGALIVDDAMNGRRAERTLVRTQWLVPPSVLGASFMLVGFALLRDAETSHQLWAGAGVAVTYALASILLQRSIWLTSVLGGVGLAMILEATGASAVQSALVWAALGLIVLAVVPFAKGLPQNQLAAIGHLFGAVAFASSGDPDAYLVALTGWAIGWIGSVVATELEQPGISQILAESDWLAGSARQPLASRAFAAAPAMFTVITSTALAITAYQRFADFPDAGAWTATVLAGLGLLLAASARYLITTREPAFIFGWSAVLLTGSSVLVAIGNDVPIVVSASAFIVVRILLIDSIRQTWLSWPAWLMPTVIIVNVGHVLGVPGQSVYLLSLASGAVMMIGSLVIDDVRSSRRSIGEGLRTPWLRYPFVVGLLIVPLSLAPVFALDTTTVGIASLAAAAGYVLVAVLLRAGSVTAPALGLATYGITMLLPSSAVEHPWILVAVASVMTAWSFAAERLQSTDAAASPWTRWDLPALVVAHAITVTALILTLGDSPDPSTWIAAGALSMLVGIWRKNRWWIDAGLLLVIVGSGLADDPWLLVGLSLAAARGMYGVWRDKGIARVVDHSIAVTAFVAAWVDLAILAEWTYVEVVSYGSVSAGAVVAIIALLSRTGLAKRDTLFVWSIVGVVGVLAAAIAGFNAMPTAVEGPWIAIGIALVAVASEQWARVFHPNIRFGTPVIAALGWTVLLTGLDTSRAESASATVIVFGLTLAVSVLISNRRLSVAKLETEQQLIDSERIWAVIALTGIAVSAALAISLDDPATWWATTLGLAFVAGAVSVGSRAVGISRLRIGTGIPVLAAFTAALMALGVTSFGIGISMTVTAAVATLGTVWLAHRHRESDWVETILIAGIAATAIAVPIAVNEFPSTELVVMILVAAGGQAIAYGVVFHRSLLVALGPPALGLASITLVAESASGSAMWYTVPIAVVMLAEADLLHRMTSSETNEQRSVALLILEWSGIALLSLPPLVEMFTTNVAFGLVGFGFAVGLLLWALLTRVKRRVLAACVVATLSTMLTLAAAAASNVQDSAALWIIGGGIGFSIMLIAGFVEAYRSRSGTLMARLGDLMEDWE